MDWKLSSLDIEAIAAAIGDGFAAVDSWPATSAGGGKLPDNSREYWVSLPGHETARVARVTAWRGPVGRWNLNAVDVYTLAATGVIPDGDMDERAAAAGEVAAAVANDPRSFCRV
jgi:hypothetical protein